MGSEIQDREFTARVEGRKALGDYAATLLSDLPLVSCVQPRNEAHRLTDFRALDWDPNRDDHPDRGDPAGPWVCGICHPAPAGFDVERRYQQR
jgi:hypothetical protein